MRIETKRLVLRPWEEKDLEPFARLNADPRVMEYFPSVMSREQSDQLALRWKAELEERGWGFWAVDLLDSQPFIGFIGLNPLTRVSLPAPFTPAVEIGWRLAFETWGYGYATEGAIASLKVGFETLKLGEIVSFTAVQNSRSQRVMEKIGMQRNSEDDFDHPKLPEGHALRRHVLYRINQREWRAFVRREGGK